MLARFRDGKIAEEWKMWDAWNVFQQIGVVPVQGDLPAITPWTINLGTTTASPQDSKNIVAAAFKVWPKTIFVGDTALDYTVHLPSSLGPDPQPGFAGAALWTKQYFSLFPDMTFTGPDGKGDYLMVAEGDLVAILYSGQFHFTQDIAGIKANGATITAPSLSFLRIKDGQTAEFWVNVDTASMMMQMMAPPAK
jgi:predicted ester cyclase